MHEDLENVPSQIISATEASRLEKLTPQSLDFWGIQCPEKTLIQSKLCQNSDLEESIMQQDNERFDSAIYQASKKPLIAFTKPPLLQRSRLTGSGNPLFESCVEGKAQQREIQVYSRNTYQIPHDSIFLKRHS